MKLSKKVFKGSRCGHGFFSMQHNLLCFGGHEKVYDQGHFTMIQKTGIFCLDLKTFTWAQMETHGDDELINRSCFGKCKLDNNIYILGKLKSFNQCILCLNRSFHTGGSIYGTRTINKISLNQIVRIKINNTSALIDTIAVNFPTPHQDIR